MIEGDVSVLVCGARDYADRDTLFARLDQQHAAVPIAVIIHGAARGADTLAGEWAAARRVPGRAFPADWDKHGRAAGPIRKRPNA